MIRELIDAIGRFRRQLPYLPMAFRLVYDAAGGLTVVWLVLLLVQGLLPVAAVYLTRSLVDGVAAIIGAGGGWETMMPLLSAGIAMALVLMGIEVFQSIGKWVRTAQSERVRDHIHELIHVET
jgi:ATP-binding cassette, subfamily B, bacterial